MIAILTESALRSLVVAVAVWAGLRAFRIGNVLAQKAAWGLVLVAALFMPLLAPLAARGPSLPAAFSVVLPAHPLSFLVRLRPAASSPAAAPAILNNPSPSGAAGLQPKSAELASSMSLAPAADPAPAGQGRYPAPAISYSNPAAPVASAHPLTPSRTLDLSPAPLAWMLYAAVAAMLLFRLVLGLAAALRLWLQALPVTLGHEFPQAAPMHLRASSAVASPVTIGSAVVLPANYDQWDAETLRIVLAHERSHIRQGDFYLQLLAGLYSALVWPSPLGWWIRRELSDLAEAISDRAGLEQAASRSSYAQILLQFAANPRPTVLGVAMARTSSLSRRIERLLNPNWVRQAFEGTRLRAVLAVLLVPAALFVATALVRVQAAQQPAQQPASATQPDSAITGQSHPEAVPAATPAADADSATQPEAAPQAEPAPLPAHSFTPQPPSPPNGPVSIVIPDGAQAMPPLPPLPEPPSKGGTRNHSYFYMRDRADVVRDDSGQGPGYSYHYSNNGDSYALVTGEARDLMEFSGDIHTGEIDKARKMAHGNFLWFHHNGKSYVVDDPAILSRLHAMYAPMDALGRQQEILGSKQEILGRQQEELGRQQEQVTVTVPDISKEMAQINAAMARLQAKMGKTVTMDELSDLQGQLGELQGRLGELQGEMGGRQGAFGAKQGNLGEQQGMLGAEQGKLGAEQGRLAMEADRQVKSIIEQTLSNGKAKPVQ